MSSKSVLALDFDGVICASQREVFLTGLEAYAHLEPGSDLGARLSSVFDLLQRLPNELDEDPLFKDFLPLVPLGNRAEDFGVGLAALDRGLVIEDQSGYDGFYAGFDPEWLRRYHHTFYECRNSRRVQDLDFWLSLHEPYPWFCELLRRRCDATTLAIATAKDALSVGLLLERFGMRDLFDRDLILDKETGVHKTKHLRALANRIDVPLGSITFVDDKVNHLEKVVPLGVRSVLAGWGYNTEREILRAKERGFEVATPRSAERILFAKTVRPRSDEG